MLEREKGFDSPTRGISEYWPSNDFLHFLTRRYLTHKNPSHLQRWQGLVNIWWAAHVAGCCSRSKPEDPFDPPLKSTIPHTLYITDPVYVTWSTWKTTTMSSIWMERKLDAYRNWLRCNHRSIYTYIYFLLSDTRPIFEPFCGQVTVLMYRDCHWEYQEVIHGRTVGKLEVIDAHEKNI